MASNDKSNNISAADASSQLGVGVQLPPQSTSQIVQSQQHLQQHISFGVKMQSSSSSPIPSNFIRKDGGSGGNYDLGELDQAFFLFLDHQNEGPSAIQEQKQNSLMKPPTLNIFPSQPMYVEPSHSHSHSHSYSSPKGNLGIVSSSSTSACPVLATVGSKRSIFEAAASMDLSYSLPKTTTTTTYLAAAAAANSQPPAAKAKAVKSEVSDKGGPAAATTNNEQQVTPKTLDPKIVRRLAQNREAARKSRLRKKAYIEQLESSRVKLTQLEQQMHINTMSQGVYIGGSALIEGDQGLPVPMGNISADAGAFDMEYRRWVKEHHQLICELRNAMQDEHLHDNQLRLYVDNCLAHMDELMTLKAMITKSDVFHLLSGAWKSPAERCFMWLGGFRPYHLMKIITNEVEAVSEQQIVSIFVLQKSTHEAEVALSQGLQNMYQSLSDTIVSDALGYPTHMPTYMAHMTVAINKLSTVEGFVRQADNLRQQAIHRLLQILTTRQAARCCLAMAEYFHHLRALSSLWLARS